MIAAWMLTASLVALFAALGGLCGEQVLRALGRQMRASWCVAIGASLLWPVLMLVFGRDEPVAGMVRLPPIRMRQLVSPALQQSSATWMPGVDRLLLALWTAASCVLLVRLAAGMRRARHVRQAAERRDLDGVAVLVSDEAGPAVIGLVHPDIVFPRALLELEPALRDVIIRHEDEHRRARDAWLAFGCAIALVLMPWNAALWWMTRRARLALEIDCDGRVLRASANPVRYAKLLLLVAQADASVQLVPALTSSRSHLERRIRAMLSTHPTHRRIRIALGSIGLVVAGIAASSAQVTGRASPDPLDTAAEPHTGVAETSPGVALHPELSQRLRARIAASGLTDPQIRDRLDTHGYPRTLLDRYLPTGGRPATSPTVATRPDTGEGPKKVAGDGYFEFKVEQQARIIDGSYFLKYPDALKDDPKPGSALVQYVVTAEGKLLPGSLKILKASDPAFVPSVRAALEMARFTPATAGRRAVRQLVQQTFDFPLPPAR